MLGLGLKSSYHVDKFNMLIAWMPSYLIIKYKIHIANYNAINRIKKFIENIIKMLPLIEDDLIIDLKKYKAFIEDY